MSNHVFSTRWEMYIFAIHKQKTKQNKTKNKTKQKTKNKKQKNKTKQKTKTKKQHIHVILLHAREFNLFYHIKNDWNIFKIFNLLVRHLI